MARLPWRRGGAPEPTPPAAYSGLSPNQAQAFEAEVRRALGRAGLAGRLQDGVALLDGSTWTYGLENIAQVWRAAEPEDRPGLVDDHLATLVAQQDAPELDPADLPAVVRLKLSPATAVSDSPADVVSLPVADDLVALLTADLPTVIKTVGSGQLEQAGLELGAVVLAARARADDGLAVQEHPLADGLVRAWWGESHFTASRLLELEGLTGPLGEHGAVVAVPHRHAIAVHPIEDMQVLQAINVLAGFAGRLHEEGPGSLSPHLYWWQDGVVRGRIEVLRGDGAISIAPPDAFVALLNELAAG